MTHAIILAGGQGTRIKSLSMPKQFFEIDGKTLLERVVTTFEHSKTIDKIIIVTCGNHINYTERICKKAGFTKIEAIISGGNSRQESSFNALKYLHDSESIQDDDIVLFHDAARVNVSEDIISKNVYACKLYDAVVTAIPSSDTVVISQDQTSVTQYLNRAELYLIQTPQTFKFKDIYEAHLSAIKDGIEQALDESSLMKHINKEVVMIQGAKTNFKVTTDDDIILEKAVCDLL